VRAAVAGLEEVLSDLDAARIPRVYSAGAQQAFLGWPAERANDLPRLGRVLERSGLSALVLRGPAGPVRSPILGYRTGGELLRRVQQALDPDQRFAGF